MNTAFRVMVLLLTLVGTAMAQSASEIETQAQQGDALAQAKLASLYLLGRDGHEQSDIHAAEWMEKAATHGLVDAQVAIAAMYDRGMGVPGNVDKATRWYEKAAAQGHATSIAILGKNDAAKGSVQFNYQAMRLNASKSIPAEYAKRFLLKK